MGLFKKWSYFSQNYAMQGYLAQLPIHYFTRLYLKIFR